MRIEQRLREMGLKLLPKPSKSVGTYVGCVRSGNLIFLSGHGPRRLSDGSLVVGVVGRDLTVEQACEAARFTALNLLTTLKEEIGDLDRVERIVKVLGMVRATPEFQDHPKVINGCSDLLVALFGERGRHARSAVGMGSLPSGICVEIEMIVEIPQTE
jgi:enamine deaminase RidA (YjgF/YER057c/UK114 family)